MHACLALQLHGTDTGRMHAGEGDVRLVSEVAVNGFTTGAVQVHVGGRFGAVCSSGFGAADAAVVCRQLGFSGPSAVLPDPFGLSGAADKGPRHSGPTLEDLQVCTGPSTQQGGDRQPLT